MYVSIAPKIKRENLSMTSRHYEDTLGDRHKDETSQDRRQA